MKSRHLVALVGGIATLAALQPISAPAQKLQQQLTPVTMSFLSRGDGAAANLVAALDQGFFRREGLDVTFLVPSNPAAAMQLVAAGTVQFAVAHSTDVILARSRELPIVSIGVTHQYGLAGVMAPAERNIRSPRDLEGLTIGITGIPANRIMLQHMLQTNGVNLDKVRILSIGFSLTPSLLAGKIDALGDAIQWADPITYNLAKGRDGNESGAYTFLPFYLHGVPRYYTFGIVTSENYLLQNADIAQRFMRGWAAGLQWSVDNPEKAVEFLLKHYPENDRRAALGMWRALSAVVSSEETKAHGLGWQSIDVWRTQEAFMRDKSLISTTVDVSRAMTNQYLPGR